MKRVLDTSVGRFVLEVYSDGTFGLWSLDEQGWETDESEWMYGLAEALVHDAGVPPDEARKIESEILQEYEERTGTRPRESGSPEWVGKAIGWSLIVLVLGTLAIGLGTIAWFLWNLG